MRVRIGVGLAILLLIVLVAYQSLPRSTADPLPTQTRAAELATLTAIGLDSPSTPAANASGTAAPGTPQGLIVFQSSRDTPGATQLYAMRADGGAVRRIGGTTPGAGFPRLSPDGTRVAFTGSTGAADDIYVVNLDGTGLARITDGMGNSRFPAWSPDSQRLAFGSDRGGDWEVYTIGIDGQGLVRITSDRADDNLPSWSPDGAWIAFQSDRDGAMRLYKVRPDGADTTPLTRGAGNDRYPSWSPDGRRIAFYSDRSGGTDQLYAIESDGTRETRLLTSSGRDQLPTWSPDGRWLVFVSERNGRWGLYQLALDQGVDRPLGQLPDSYAPTWGVATPAAAGLLAGTRPTAPTVVPTTAIPPTATRPFAAVPAATPTLIPTSPPPTSIPGAAAAVTPSSVPAGIGQTVRMRNWELVVRGVGRPGQNLAWSEAGDIAFATGTWLVVTIDLKNVGSRDFGVSAWDFTVFAADGAEFGLSNDAGASAYSSFQGGGFVGEAVPPGSIARYYLVFDVAATATGLRFAFEQEARPVIDLGQ